LCAAAALPVHIATIPDPDYQYGQFVVFNRVYDAVVALANAVKTLAGELLASWWARLAG